MVNRKQFEEICNKYGLDSKKLIKNNENVLEKADYNSICYVRDTLKVTPNNIEKCPSILYLKIEAIKENWNFLNEKKINTRDVETCLHILSTDPEQLKKTYEYVSAENRYGKKYIEQITTILRVSVERIQEIEEKCPELTRENILSAAISRKGVDEIKEIVRVCQKNEVKVTDGERKIILVTENGMSICFDEKDIRITGRVSMGVIGIKLDEGDEVSGVTALSAADILAGGKKVILLTKKGLSLGFPLEEVSEFKKTSRGVKGIALEKEDTIVHSTIVDLTQETFEYDGKTLDARHVRNRKRAAKGQKANLEWKG